VLSYSHARGLPAFTLDKGRKIGQLDEVLIDVGRRTIRWLRLRGRGWFTRTQWVPARAVHDVGADAVILANGQDVTEAPDWSQDPPLIDARQDLLGKPVLTEHGDSLGSVRDYEFSPHELALTTLYVSPRFGLSGQLETIPLERVLTIGEDAVIVAGDGPGQPVTEGAQHGLDQ
jgi:sporulation protein YlmC with PRC-barrel domain